MGCVCITPKLPTSLCIPHQLWRVTFLALRVINILKRDLQNISEYPGIWGVGRGVSNFPFASSISSLRKLTPEEEILKTHYHTAAHLLPLKRRKTWATHLFFLGGFGPNLLATQCRQEKNCLGFFLSFWDSSGLGFFFFFFVMLGGWFHSFPHKSMIKHKDFFKKGPLEFHPSPSPAPKNEQSFPQTRHCLLLFYAFSMAAATKVVTFPCYWRRWREKIL